MNPQLFRIPSLTELLWALRARSLIGLFLIAFGLPPQVAAQTPPELAIQTYAGLTITGTVGTVYSIEYVSDIAETNVSGAWRSVEFLRLPRTPHLWTDTHALANGKRFYRAVVFPVMSNMGFVPPGTFRMGSSVEENSSASGWERPQTDVTISRGFWMGKYEVTQAEFQSITGANPSYYRGDNLPVENVTWPAATNFCAKLTQQELTAGRIPKGSVYCLPTEAQWEYACRAWTSTRFSYGDDPDYVELPDYCWHIANSPDGTQPVGLLRPNPWGLHDMHGNVWEWCQDWWTAGLSGGVLIDPQGPTTGTDRVLRGGGYPYAPDICRSASRFFCSPFLPVPRNGFRVVLVAGQP